MTGDKRKYTSEEVAVIEKLRDTLANGSFGGPWVDMGSNPFCNAEDRVVRKALKQTGNIGGCCCHDKDGNQYRYEEMGAVSPKPKSESVSMAPPSPYYESVDSPRCVCTDKYGNLQPAKLGPCDSDEFDDEIEVQELLTKWGQRMREESDRE